VLQAKTLQQLEDRATACYKKGDFRQVSTTNLVYLHKQS